MLLQDSQNVIYGAISIFLKRFDKTFTSALLKEHYVIIATSNSDAE